MNLQELKISQHAKERYAERIMDKDNKTDIAIFIANNEEKIRVDITKMIEYGQFLYSGKPIDLFNKQPVEVYLNGTWIIIVDSRKSNVITLYSIDLGVGDDFNAQYIGKLLDKLNIAKKNLLDMKNSIETETNTYTALLNDNDVAIAEYKKIIKSLEQQNEGYRMMINTLQANVMIADKSVRDIVATLIGKKVF